MDPPQQPSWPPANISSSTTKKNVRFKRSKIFVTPSADSAEEHEQHADKEPAVSSISRLVSYSSLAYPVPPVSKSLLYSPASNMSSPSCSPSSISESQYHAPTESSPLLETPEAIRTWSLQQKHLGGSNYGNNTTFVSSSSSPGATAAEFYDPSGAGNGNGGGNYHYSYSELRAEMNASTPTKPSWKSMLVRAGGTGVNDDYYYSSYPSSSSSSRWWRWCGGECEDGDGRRARRYAFIALLGAFLFTLVWLVTIEPCGTSDSIHSAIKLVFGRKSHKSTVTELAKFTAWIEKSGKIFRNSKSEADGEDEQGDSGDSSSSDNDNNDDIEEPLPSVLSSSSVSDPFRLVLLGDSLVSESYKKLDLGGVIESLLDSATTEVSVINCGKSGSQIHTIRQRPLLNCTLPHSPDATILFFDSDVSAVDEADMTDEEVADVRAQYKTDTSYVVQTLLDAGSQVKKKRVPCRCRKEKQQITLNIHH